MEAFWYLYVDFLFENTIEKCSFYIQLERVHVIMRRNGQGHADSVNADDGGKSIFVVYPFSLGKSFCA